MCLSFLPNVLKFLKCKIVLFAANAKAVLEESRTPLRALSLWIIQFLESKAMRRHEMKAFLLCPGALQCDPSAVSGDDWEFCFRSALLT